MNGKLHAGEPDREALLRERVVQVLGEETAQLLGYVLVELAALREMDQLEDIHAGLDELPESVRMELGRVLQLAEDVGKL